MVQHTTIALTKPVSAIAAQKLEHTLWLTPGVWLVWVNPVKATAYVEYEDDQCTAQALEHLVARSGTVAPAAAS